MVTLGTVAGAVEKVGQRGVRLRKENVERIVQKGEEMVDSIRNKFSVLKIKGYQCRASASVIVIAQNNEAMTEVRVNRTEEAYRAIEHGAQL